MLKKYRRLNVHAIRGGQDLADQSPAHQVRHQLALPHQACAIKGRAAAEAWLDRRRRTRRHEQI
jgi:NTE family protein